MQKLNFVISVLIITFISYINGQLTVLQSCLGSTLANQLVLSSSQNYYSLSTGIRAVVPRAPTAILVVTSVNDISKAVICAVKSLVLPVVRAGGHSYEDLSSMSNSLIIDISNLNSVSVNGNKATIQAGARLGKVYLDLWNQGSWTISAGLCPSVGIGGHVTGGGWGMQTRVKGLAADQVVSMNVVLADGSTVTASSTENPDLYWALRGGGSGSFGIVTSYTLQLFQLPATSAMFYLTFYLNVEVLTTWQNYFPKAVAELSSQVTIFQKEIQMKGFYMGSMSTLQSLLKSSGILSLSSLKSQNYKDCNGIGVRLYLWFDLSCSDLSILNVPSSTAQYPKDYGYSKSDYVSTALPTNALNSIISLLNQSPNQWGAYVQFDPSGGGYMNTVSSTATPYPNRAGTLYGIQYYVSLYQNEPTTSYSYTWINNVQSTLKPYVTGQKYQNYPDLSIGSNYGNLYFGSTNFNKLQQVKAVYDPNNVFRNDQSIPVAHYNAESSLEQPYIKPSGNNYNNVSNSESIKKENRKNKKFLKEKNKINN